MGIRLFHTILHDSILVSGEDVDTLAVGLGWLWRGVERGGVNTEAEDGCCAVAEEEVACGLV